MEKSWNEYYKNHSFRLSNILLHIPYLFAIIRMRPLSILEIGCGPADHSLLIKRILPDTKIFLLDLDSILLERVLNTHKPLIEKCYNISILNNKDLQNACIPRVDLVISQGLMEHFSDEDFRAIIMNFSKIAPRMIFSLPSAEYPTRDFGNEILRNKDELSQVLASIPGIRFQIYKYVDLGIKTKLLKIRKTKMALLQALFYLFFGSNHYTVSVTYEDFV